MTILVTGKRIPKVFFAMEFTLQKNWKRNSIGMTQKLVPIYVVDVKVYETNK